jgi:hypothetical protein
MDANVERIAAIIGTLRVRFAYVPPGQGIYAVDDTDTEP